MLYVDGLGEARQSVDRGQGVSMAVRSRGSFVRIARNLTQSHCSVKAPGWSKPPARSTFGRLEFQLAICRPGDTHHRASSAKLAAYPVAAVAFSTEQRSVAHRESRPVRAKRGE
jgi:hypothetical protein